MSNLNSRIRSIAKAIDMNKELFPGMPDFENWSDENLDQYIAKKLNQFHKDSLIKSFADAKRVLDSELERDLISMDDYNIILIGEEIYWNETS